MRYSEGVRSDVATSSTSGTKRMRITNPTRNRPSRATHPSGTSLRDDVRDRAGIRDDARTGACARLEEREGHQVVLACAQHERRGVVEIDHPLPRNSADEADQIFDAEGRGETDEGRILGTRSSYD